MKKIYLTILILGLLLLFLAGCTERTGEAYKAAPTKVSPSSKSDLTVNELISSGKEKIYDDDKDTEVYIGNAKLSSYAGKDQTEKIKGFLKEKFDIQADELELESTKEKGKLKYIKLRQYYKNVPVYNGYTMILLKDDNVVYSKVKHNKGINLDAVPKADEKKAKDDLKKYIALSLSNKVSVTNDAAQNPTYFNERTFYDISGKKHFYQYGADINKVLSVDLKPSLTIYKKDNKNRLAWQIETPLIKEIPAKYVYFVDANTGGIIDVRNTVISYEISGTVKGMEWEDPFPAGIHDEKYFKNNYVWLSGWQAAITSVYGKYGYTDISGPGTIDSLLQGPFVGVFNYESSNTHHTATLDENTNILNWNWADYDTSYLQEESNVFYHVNQIHDYAVGVGAVEMNYPIAAWVNLRGVCNAFFDTSGYVGFYPANDECESTAVISDVIYHEYGHGIVHTLDPALLEAGYWDQSGNLHEGLADYWACTMNNNADQGEGFYKGSTTGLRRCDTDDKYPDNYFTEPHSGCQIVSGALWDIREQIGKENLDLIIVNALRMQPVTFSEFLEALVIMDIIEGSAENTALICEAFSQHGIFAGVCAGQTSEPMASINKFDSKVSGIIDVQGIAYPSSGAVLNNYVLSYTSNGVTTELGTFTTPVADGNLISSLDTRLLTDGYGTLSLFVFDSADKSASYSTDMTIDNIFFTAPRQGELFGIGDIIDINATILSIFDSFNVQWEYNYTGMLSSEGITMQGYENPIDHTKIAELNTAYLTKGGPYQLHLRVTKGDIVYDEILYDLAFDPTIKAGFPVRLNPEWTEYWELYMPAGPSELQTADLNNDGFKEIIFATSGKYLRLHVINKDGANMPGWPKEFPKTNSNMPTGNLPSPAIADIDNDGSEEILQMNLFDDTKLYAFNGDGSDVLGFPVVLPGSIGDPSPAYIFQASLQLADLNNDGKLEIIIYSEDGLLYILNSKGQVLQGYPKSWGVGGMTIISLNSKTQIAIGNLDKDSDLEVLYPENIYNYVDDIYGVNLKAINMDGTMLPGWPLTLTNGWIFSAMSIGDLEADGTNEIITPVFDDIFTPPTNYGLTVFSNLGKVKSGWPVFQDQMMFHQPAIADIDADNSAEIIYSDYYLDEGEYLYSLESNGANTIGWPIRKEPCVVNTWMEGVSPIIITDRNNNKVIVDDSGCTKFVAYDKYGNMLGRFPKFGNAVVSFPRVVDDIDNDGKYEIIASSFINNPYDSDGQLKSIRYILVYETDIDKGVKAEWPKYRYDSQNTGYYQRNCGLLQSRTCKYALNQGLGEYCLDGKIIYNCQKCGCMKGYTCQTDGKCSKPVTGSPVFAKPTPLVGTE